MVLGLPHHGIIDLVEAAAGLMYMFQVNVTPEEWIKDNFTFEVTPELLTICSLMGVLLFGLRLTVFIAK
jgi:hypothetical protein